MEQVTDWVRPPSSTALRVQGEAAPRAAPALRATVRTAAAAAPLQPRTPQAAAPAPAAPRSSAPVEEIIEVPAEDMDLAALAELAKKAIERKT
jgi:hypothetical protein